MGRQASVGTESYNSNDFRQFAKDRDKNSQTTIVEQENQKTNGNHTWLVEVEKEKAFLEYLERNVMVEKPDDYIKKNNKINTCCYYFLRSIFFGNRYFFSRFFPLLSISGVFKITRFHSKIHAYQFFSTCLVCCIRIY